MSVRKGEATDRIIDREWPHQVAVIWPEQRHCRLYDVMLAPASGLGPYRKRGLGKLVPDRSTDGTRWCFRDEDHAIKFQFVFGGDRLVVIPPTRPGGRYLPVLKSPASNSGGSGVLTHSGPAGIDPQRYSRPDES